MKLDRRTFLGGTLGTAAGGLLMTPTLPAWSQSAGPNEAYFAKLYEDAKKEGEVNWYIAHWTTEMAEAVAKAFGETYPGVKCNVVRATSQVIYQRLTQDLKAQVSNCDVFSSADNGQYVTLKQQKHLLAYEPKNLAFCVPLLQDYDPAHFITITDANPTILAYNTKLVPAAEAPTKWTDFLDPKWMGQVALAHPGYSGAMGAWTVAMNNLYGWDFFEKLAKNKPFVGRSLADPPVTIASGERKIGMSTMGSAVSMQARGNTIAPAYPADGAIMNVGPTSIIANTKHPNAARLFIEFMLGKKTAEIVTAEGTIPVRTDVKPKYGVQPLGEMKGIKSDPVELAAKVPELIEKWRDTFGV
jgi:iron(III) transport system substrate-binding protein